MFRSAAISHSDGVIGVLLSGMLSDGTAGFWQIRKCGGVTIAQDPKEAQYASMPQSAMKDVPVDYCLPASEIAPKLLELVRSSAPQPAFRKGRVMIVEDEWLIASDLETQLNDLVYEVVANVVSAEEALRSAACIAPDVVIMDVHLGGRMRGTEAAMHLREQFQIPSIFLTAYNDLETLTSAQRSRPYAFLAKPHHATELNVAIQLALNARANRFAG
jgi:chemotaxis response regulator CheB